MPWFETPATIGKWGWHWTMNSKDPENITDGKRQIASHFYPLIGPYASRDKDVIEYHLLLMKLSGIDGILINWYGIAGTNTDIHDLLVSSDSIVSRAANFGMQFAVVMEDRFSSSIDDVKKNMNYLKSNYFKREEYIKYGSENQPLVCIFGPITFEQNAEWNKILPSAGDIEFLSLWYESEQIGNGADGEFTWVYQDSLNHLEHLNNFYQNRAPKLKTVIGSAYPGFYDFYKDGNVGEGYFNIPSNSGVTLDQTLQETEQFKDRIDMLQLITFNDFGEGTMFEPTVETGFDYLKKIQKFTGVKYGEEELKLVLRLFVLRKDYTDNLHIIQQLDNASNHLNNLEIEQAADILNNIDPITVLKP